MCARDEHVEGDAPPCQSSEVGEIAADFACVVVRGIPCPVVENGCEGVDGEEEAEDRED